MNLGFWYTWAYYGVWISSVVEIKHLGGKCPDF